MPYMKKFSACSIVCFVLILFSTSFVAAADKMPNLMPYPQSVAMGKGVISLPNHLTVRFKGVQSSRAESSVARFITRLNGLGGDTVSLAKIDGKGAFIQIDIEQSADGNFLMEDAEAYTLSVKKRGIKVKAETDLGVIRAMMTLSQMLEVDGLTLQLPKVKIKDEPRFAWRGLLLDSARHFFTVETVKRQLDGMEAAKLNVFHWHLTDDQGWRLESKKFPKLTELGSDGLFYSQSEIKEVVAYARERGIEVLPEIDFPGHTSALAIAYPELMTNPGPYEPEDRWGVHKPLMDPTKEGVYQFVDALVTEVTGLFPFPYVHIGGDEVDPEAWEAAEHVQEFVKNAGIEGSRGLHLYFNHRVGKILSKYNRKLIGWDEILYEGLPNDFIVQSWRGHSSLAEAANKGYGAILSTGFYLDQPQPASYHYRNDPIVPSAERNVEKAKIDLSKVESYWAFEMPRKRGSSVKGKMGFVKDGKQNYLLLALNNKSALKVDKIETRFGEYHFSVDSWMGDTEFQITLTDGVLQGRVKVGNAFYSISGKQVESATFDFSDTQVLEDNADNILGGEVALWSELIDEGSVDIRLWPRAFVVAERLWSSSSLVDPESMYTRMEAVSAWSADTLDLEQFKQAETRLESLRGKASVDELEKLADAVEAAQYYHRHHEKSANETYSRKDPLDRFVDALPAENLHVRRLKSELAAWKLLESRKSLPTSIKQNFKDWASIGQTLQNHESAEIAVIAYKVNQVSVLGLKLVRAHEEGIELDGKQVEEMRLKLIELQAITGECVVVAAQLALQLLEYFESKNS